MSLFDIRDEIITELNEWLKNYSFQIENIQETMESHVFRRLNGDLPLTKMKILDASSLKNSLPLPQYDSLDVTSSYPKGIQRIYTPLTTEEALENPSLVDHISYIDEIVYLETREFRTKMTIDNTLLFVPVISDDITEIYIEFIYPWKDLTQFPETFRDVFVLACRLEAMQEMMNSTMFADSTDVAFRGLANESKTQFVLTLENQFKLCRDMYIAEVNRMHQNFYEYSEH